MKALYTLILFCMLAAYAGQSWSYAAKTDSDYRSVNEQSGIYAGEGGFDIQVGKHTALDGAVIDSRAGADKNRLSTATLSYDDLQNNAAYNSESSSVGISTNGPSGFGTGSEKGSDSSTSRSAVAAGTLDIRDSENQQQDINGLSRDPGQSHRALAQIFDKEAVAERQELAQLFGEEAFRAVGDLAERQRKKAAAELVDADLQRREALASGDSAAQAEAEQRIADANASLDRWAEGGIARVALHTVIGGLQAEMANGNALSGAAGAATSASMTGKVKEQVEKAVAGLPPELRQTVANLATNAIDGAAGSAIDSLSGGGSSGAQAALGVDRYNRQLHKDEVKVIQLLAGENTQDEARLRIAACALTRCAAEFPEGSAEYQLAKQMEEMGNSPEFAMERQLLAQQTLDGEPMFDYTKWDGRFDSAKKFNNEYQVTTRGAGMLQMVGGTMVAVESSAMVVTGGASCPETFGAGCLVAAAGIGGVAWGSDQIQAGANTAYYGRMQPTLGGYMLEEMTGMSPQTAELVYGMVGVGPVLTQGMMSLRTAGQGYVAAEAGGVENALNVNLVGDTRGFNALGVSADPKASQQGRLLMQQYRHQYPDMPLRDIETLARSTLQTGDALPSVSIGKPGDTFYKLIPSGETRGPSQSTVYWMDKSQLDSVMSGNIDIGSQFGLPNKTTSGSYHAFETTVRDAQAPLVFRSNVAPVVDDGIFKIGGQTQTIIPKRSAFTQPVQLLDGSGNPLVIWSR
jgi:filamentous hemagglutinin